MRWIEARPEEAIIFVYALPCHPVVVGDAPFRGDAQFLEDLARGGVIELVALAETLGDFADDLPVLPCFAGRTHHLAMADDPAFHISCGAFVLFHQGTSQNDVGIASRLRQEKIDVDVELQLLQGLAHVVRIWQRDRRIEADGKQTLDLAVVNRLNQRHGRQTFARKRLLRHAPNTGDVLAVLGIRDVSVAGELVALLSLLACTLAVALAGNHGVAAALASDAPTGNYQIDRSNAVLHPL